MGGTRSEGEMGKEGMETMDRRGGGKAWSRDWRKGWRVGGIEGKGIEWIGGGKKRDGIILLVLKVREDIERREKTHLEGRWETMGGIEEKGGIRELEMGGIEWVGGVEEKGGIEGVEETGGMRGPEETGGMLGGFEDCTSGILFCGV